MGGEGLYTNTQQNKDRRATCRDHDSTATTGGKREVSSSLFCTREGVSPHRSTQCAKPASFQSPHTTSTAMNPTRAEKASILTCPLPARASSYEK